MDQAHSNSLTGLLLVLLTSCGSPTGPSATASTEPGPPETSIVNAVTTATATSISPATTSGLEAVVLLPVGGTTAGARLRLNVPDSWTRYKDFFVLKNGSNPPSGMAVGFWTVGNIFSDRCQWQGALLDPPVGSTVDDLASAITEHWGGDATTPIDIVVDGFAGKEMVVAVPSDMDFSACDEGYFQSWIGANDGVRFHQGRGQEDQLWILEIDGERLVIGSSYFPETSAEDRAELRAIVDSIKVEP